MPEDEQDVPGEGAKTRAPDLQQALDHATRREILRALIGANEDMTIEELADLVPTANVSSLNYHVFVLEREGCVSRAGEIALANGMLPTYAATVADSQFVMDILDGTRGEDRGRSTE